MWSGYTKSCGALMFKFGYDFFDSKTRTIKRPNGTRYNKKIIGQICQLYLPPWWGELLGNAGEKFEINSVKHYSENQYKEKWIYILEPLGDPRGWFGKYEDGQENKVKSFFHNISSLALNQVRENRAIIFVWHAQEGPSINHLNINLYEEFYKELDRFKINPSNFVYVTGNLKSKKQYKKWKGMKTSWYKNGQERSEYTYMDREDISIIELQAQRHLNYPKKWKLANFNKNKDIKKKFLCFNRELGHPHRLFLLTLLKEKNLLKDGMVSFNKINNYHKQVFRNNLLGHFNLGKSLVNKHGKILKDLEKNSPSIIDVDEWNTNHYDTSPSWTYEQTFFSLVSESHFVQDTLYMSEKIWKAIANNHIFIAVAPFQTLKSIRSRGFKTFQPYIDESYDNEVHPYKRIKMIVTEVERLCKLSDREIKEIIVKTEEVVKYNYDKLINDHSYLNVVFKELEQVI
jgi:hypothetical protein